MPFCDFGFCSDFFDLLSFISICLSNGIKFQRSESNVFSYFYLKFERNTLTNNQTRWYYIGVGLEVAACVHRCNMSNSICLVEI